MVYTKGNNKGILHVFTNLFCCCKKKKKNQKQSKNKEFSDVKNVNVHVFLIQRFW